MKNRQKSNHSTESATMNAMSSHAQSVSTSERLTHPL